MRYDPVKETLTREAVSLLVNYGQYGSHPTDVIAYTFDADIYCPTCTAMRYGLNDGGWVPEEAEDSEGNPVHPVFGDAESDTPEHCADCRDFLGNDLTGDGYEYVLGAVVSHIVDRADGDGAVLAEWWGRYGGNYEEGDLAEAFSAVAKGVFA